MQPYQQSESISNGCGTFWLKEHLESAARSLTMSWNLARCSVGLASGQGPDLPGSGRHLVRSCHHSNSFEDQGGVQSHGPEL